MTQAPATAAEVSIEGEISNLRGSCPSVTFVVEGDLNRKDAQAKTTVNAGSQTIYTGGSCGDLREKRKVKVVGTVTPDKKVDATRVELSR